MQATPVWLSVALAVFIVVPLFVKRVMRTKGVEPTFLKSLGVVLLGMLLFGLVEAAKTVIPIEMPMALQAVPNIVMSFFVALLYQKLLAVDGQQASYARSFGAVLGGGSIFAAFLLGAVVLFADAGL